jgi:aspartate aminotransferase
MLDFPELSENCIIIDSESKRYSMCGVRIGCMVTRSKKSVMQQCFLHRQD